MAETPRGGQLLHKKYLDLEDPNQQFKGIAVSCHAVGRYGVISKGAP